MGKPVNTVGHDATGGLSLDGNKLFVYRAGEGNGKGKNKGGDLYMSDFVDGKWSEPVKLGKNINKRKALDATPQTIL